MNNPENSKIVISYNGNFADRIEWAESKLAKFADVSHLKTIVTIKDSDERPRTSITNLGDLLAWRRFVNPLEYFGQTTAIGKQARVITDFETGQSEIQINHHVVTQDVVSRSKDRIDDRLFVEQVNGLVNTGLAKVLAQEKQRQFLTNVLVHGKHLALTAAEVGILAGTSYSFFILRPFGHLIDLLLPPSHLSGDPFNDFFINSSNWMTQTGGVVADYSMGFSVGIHSLAFLIRGGLNYLIDIKTGNYNPLNPIKDFIAGKSFLLTKGRDLAVYSENTQDLVK